MMRAVLGALVALFLSAGVACAQGGYLCRTSPVGGSNPVSMAPACSSEAFVSSHFPSSSTAGHLATFADTSGQVLQDGGTPAVTGCGTGLVNDSGNCITAPGVDTNILNAVTGAITIASTSGYCGQTVSWSGAAATITLNGVSGFSSTCSIRICNANANDNAHHAATLSGFPAPALAHLWMRQCITVAIQNGAWQITQFPGKFIPAFGVSCYADTGGSNSNDGLVSNASTNAVADPQQCIQTWRNEFDTSSLGQPTVCLTGGETYNQNGSPGALTLQTFPLVINVETCSGASNSVLRTTGGNVVVDQEDFGGYIIFANGGTAGVTLDCTNAGSHPCYGFFDHQQGGFDIFNAGGSVKFIGAASSDYGIYCDSLCKGNINNPPIFSGSFVDVIYASQGSRIVVGAGLDLSSATLGLSLAHIVEGSSLVWSGTLTLGGSTISNYYFLTTNVSHITLANTFATSGSASGSPVSYAALNGSVFCNASPTAVPGTAGQTTGTGWTPGAAVASSGACTP